MKITEIEMINDQEFPYEKAAQLLAVTSLRGMFSGQEFQINYAEAGDDRIIILTDEDNKIAAFVGFLSRLNGRVWQSKNVATYSPYQGQRLAGRIYKYVKEVLKKSIQSDIDQSRAGRKLWIKTLPELGLKPMMFDTSTEKILDPKDFDMSKIYPKDDASPILHRYCWILERFDHYPDQNLIESSLLQPIQGLWYRP